MRSPNSVPENERTLSERASIRIDDDIEYASQALEAGAREMSKATDAAIEKGTQAMSTAIGGAVKATIDFSKEKFSELTDKASNLEDFKESMKEGHSDDDLGLEITDTAEIKGFTEPDQLQEGITVSMAEHTTEARLDAATATDYVNLADKRQQEAESANTIKSLDEDTAEKKPVQDRGYDRMAEVNAMNAQIEAKQLQQKQADEEYEEQMMQPKSYRM